MKIAITFPIYVTNEDHIYFTTQTLESIQTKHEVEIYVVENYIKPEFRQEVDNIIKQFNATLITNNLGNNVANAWNIGIQTAFSNSIEYVLVPNNDIVMHPQCIDNLVKFMQGTEDKFLLWTALEHSSLRTLKTLELTDNHDNHPGFSFFAVTKSSLEKLKEKEAGTSEPQPGLFDPNYIAAYFEDGDMACRILKAGYEAGKTASARYYHFGSRTIKVDERLNQKNATTYENNRNYFIKKWGIDTHGVATSNDDLINKTYKTPFNK